MNNDEYGYFYLSNNDIYNKSRYCHYDIKRISS